MKNMKNTDNAINNSKPIPPSTLPFRTLRPTLGLLMLLMLTVTPILSACGQQQQLVLTGTVEAYASDIVTETSGRVTELVLSEGATVAAGDVIARLDGAIQATVVRQLEQAVVAKAAMLKELQNGNRTEQRDQARFAVDAARARYEEARQGPSSEAVRAAEAQVAIARTAVDGAVVQLAHTKQMEQDAETLHRDGAIADAAYEDAVFAHEVSSVALQTAQKQLDASIAQLNQVKHGAGEEAVAAAKAQMDQTDAQLAQVENGATDTTLAMAEADLAQSQAALEQGQLMLERYTLRAPCDGTITLLSVNQGEVVNAGAAIGTISQLSDLSVQLYIPQRNLAAIQLGDSLCLTATSFPDKRFPGAITFISDKAEFTPRNTETTASKESTVFRFEVAVSQPDSGLKPGMALEVGIPGAYSEQRGGAS